MSKDPDHAATKGEPIGSKKKKNEGKTKTHVKDRLRRPLIGWSLMQGKNTLAMKKGSGREIGGCLTRMGEKPADLKRWVGDAG